MAGVTHQDAHASMQACQTAMAPGWGRREAECDLNAQQVLNPRTGGNMVSRNAPQEGRRIVRPHVDNSTQVAGPSSRQELACDTNAAESSERRNPGEGKMTQGQNGQNGPPEVKDRSMAGSHEPTQGMQLNRQARRKADQLVRKTAIRVAALNMNGFRSLQPDHPNNKWG